MPIKILISTFFLSLFYSQPCFANVVWPGLYLAFRMVYLSIPIGILIETIILKGILKKGWRNALFVTLVINLISVIIGALGALLGNLAFEFTLGQILFRFFNIGTFNPLSWSTAIILGALVSAFIEAYALLFLFKIRLTKKQFLILLMANLFSTLVAFFSILIKKPFF